MKPEMQEREFIKRLFNDLILLNRSIPIIVEGKRDRIALKKIGIKGKVILLHRGQNLYEFCEDVLRRHEKVILLLDWDRKGQQIYQKVSDLLKGHFEEYSLFRDTLIKLFGDEIKEVEEIPRILKGYGIL
ncbi:MAG TPA: toprim domain-containing protein [Nitrospirae bacterium]|nr:toprim domain-containing protein [Nitrospirota bacterium]